MDQQIIWLLIIIQADGADRVQDGIAADSFLNRLSFVAENEEDNPENKVLNSNIAHMINENFDNIQ